MLGRWVAPQSLLEFRLSHPPVIRSYNPFSHRGSTKISLKRVVRNALRMGNDHCINSIPVLGPSPKMVLPTSTKFKNQVITDSANRHKIGEVFRRSTPSEHASHPVDVIDVIDIHICGDEIPAYRSRTNDSKNL